MILKEVVVVAILVSLAVVFIISCSVLLCLCRIRYVKRKNSKGAKETLIGNGQATLEMGDFRLHPDIELILSRHQFLDSCGLEPQCLAILRSCHKVTESLAAVAITLAQNHKMQRVAEVARQTSQRVDDVMRSMLPPVDARLLEARATTLVLTVSHLAILMNFAYKHNQRLSKTISEELDTMQPLLQELQEAAKTKDENVFTELGAASVKSSNLQDYD